MGEENGILDSLEQVKRAAAEQHSSRERVEPEDLKKRRKSSRFEELASQLLKPQDKLRYNEKMLIAKGLVCLALFVFIWAGVIVTVSQEDFSIQCQQSGGLCVFTWMGFLFSLALLLPNILEMGHTNLVLLGSKKATTGELLAKIKTQNPWVYVKEGLVWAIGSFLFGMFFFLVALSLPVTVLRNGRGSEEVGKALSVLVRLFAVLSDSLLTWSLVPLSGFIIFSSESPADVITNVVAMQVFAGMDDVIVKMLFDPAESIQSVFKLYLGNGVTAVDLEKGGED